MQEAAAAEGRLRLPDVWANAGGVALAMNNTGAAVQQFTTALRRFHFNSEHKLLWWKARCGFCLVLGCGLARGVCNQCELTSYPGPETPSSVHQPATTQMQVCTKSTLIQFTFI